jgi:hypothetical protein
VNAIAGFDTNLKRHEAFSRPFCSWSVALTLRSMMCAGPSSERFSCRRASAATEQVFATRSLITVFMQPLDLGQAGRNRRQEPFMYDTYIIETPKGAAGIVVRDGRGFRFFAAIHDFNDLEGRVFGTPKEAEAAALRHVDGGGARVKIPRQFELSRQWSR